MENESKKLEIAKVVLGAAFAVVMVGISFGVGGYAKELAVVKQSQRELQVVIEDVQDDTEQMRGKIAAVEQEQLKLRAEIKDVENNMEELVGNIAETIERNQLKLQGMIEDVRNNTQELVAGMAETVQRSQLELHDAIENVRKNTRQIAGKVAAIEQNQLEFQGLIKQISKQVLPGDSLEVISVEPACPAVLDLGEKLRVKVRYRVVSSDSVRIWVRPYTRGRRTSGYKAHGSSTYEKGTGVVEGYFFFDKPTVVDEVRINMRGVAIGKDVHTISYKIDARWIGSKVDKKEQARLRKTEDKRILVDINNPEGERGWRDEYVIKLEPTGDIRKEFGVNWYRPHRVARISTEKPDLINTLPKFKYEMQRYLTLRLGDAENNEIVGVMDFRKPDRNHFPFDLYLDRDRDGDLAEDFIEDRRHIKGICAAYNDGTVENYSLNLYSYSTNSEPIGVAYQSRAGRYGILEADKKRIQLLVIDNSGNGIFNDDDDVILLDWDLDGKIDGSHQADDDRPLYSLLELPGASYRVAEFDAQGRRMVLRRQGAK